MTTTSSNIREVNHDVELGGKTIAKGCKVFVPLRQLMLDEMSFGSDADEMVPDRFMRTKGLDRSGYYRPFGGGQTLCSGRYIARREVLAFLAVVL